MNRRQFLCKTGWGVAGTGLGLAGLNARAASAQTKQPVYVFSKHLQFLGYEELGETAAARATLKKALASQTRFMERDAAQKLLDSFPAEGK